MNTGVQEKLAEIVDRIPELDKRGTFTGPSWEEAIPIFDDVLLGGRDFIVGLVALLKDPDDGSDYRPRYLLHGLAQYLGRPGKESPRAIFAQALVTQLGGERPKSVQGFVIRQLQVIGGPEAAGALGSLLGDPDLFEYAAQALLAIRTGAAAQFRKAFPSLEGPPRLTTIQALGVLADRDSSPGLKKAATDPDREIRLAAVWALARIGDPGASETVLKASDAEPGYERIKAASAALLFAENLLAAGRKADAQAVYRHLKETRGDPEEAYLRQIAQEGLTRSGG
jgi:hypothetical protein